MAAVTVATLKGLHCDEFFLSFWRMVIEKQRSVDVSESTLPRRSKVPRRYDIGMSFGHFPASIEDHNRPIYYHFNKMKKEVGMLLQKRTDTSAVGIYKLYEENTH